MQVACSHRELEADRLSFGPVYDMVAELHGEQIVQHDELARRLSDPAYQPKTPEELKLRNWLNAPRRRKE
jgi:hypothetical protein